MKRERFYIIITTGICLFCLVECSTLTAQINFPTQTLDKHLDVKDTKSLSAYRANSGLNIDRSKSAGISIADLPELIDTVGIDFDKSSGFYQSDITLTMTSPDAEAQVVYTLDGNNPRTSSTRIIGAATTQVLINPASNVNRGTTPAVVVRASIIKDGFSASKPELRTYIYLAKVKTQSQPGWDWPAEFNSGYDFQHIDLAMDPDVVNSTQYKDKIDEALLAIPSISVVTDNANLFDPESGIYVNAIEDGAEWERECSVELINPDGSDGFNVNAGLRIRGGFSREVEYPKHAFRLFFRKEYGDIKLVYPLFENEGVDEFDKIDLRCEQNYSWSVGKGQFNTYIREVFARDAQGESENPYTRSKYYHLYLNGMYWGLYQTQERAEANFAADYLGGEEEDYDVIKTDNQNDYQVIAVDGNLNKWKDIWNISIKGYTNNTNYFKLEGKDALGKPLKNVEILVDINDLIDYMINIFYTGNYDSPVSKFFFNKTPNNMYCIKNRENKSKGFVFFVHDAEHTMMMGISSGPGIGLQENRVNIGGISDFYQMTVSEFSHFHPQWLHHILSENAEYRMRFSDIAWKRFNGNGVFTEEACINRLNKRAATIDMAVIAESARWGDAKSANGLPYTKDNAWLPEINSLRNNYFPYRTDIVIAQLTDAGLYSSMAPPVIEKADQEILNSEVKISEATTITFSASSGEIYYTLNGDDPRMIGGELSPKAIKIASGSSLSIAQSALIKSRVYESSNWSAIREINFIAPQTDFSKFKITELHYHPLDNLNDIDTIDGQ
jgi:hypothetical protein